MLFDLNSQPSQNEYPTQTWPARNGLHILLVEPASSQRYHTCFPPLALLKLAAFHQRQGDHVHLVKGVTSDGIDADLIYITSLFTYAWQPVHEVIRFYRDRYPRAKVVVGGIYATLCPSHLRESFGDSIEITCGINPALDNLRPAYELVPEWSASILFSSRGCPRKCGFCSVGQLEPEFYCRASIRDLIYPSHKRIILWDNNILASPYWREIFGELKSIGWPVDFNQGLDARLLSDEVVQQIAKMNVPFIRLAYDKADVRESIQDAIVLLKRSGYRGRDIGVYCLYNFTDSPADFLFRIRDLLNWGVVAYPMRYEPLEPRKKNTYVSSKWTAEQLELVADARRVLGYGGAFPPYEGLVGKFNRADSFKDAFALRKKRKRKLA